MAHDNDISLRIGHRQWRLGQVLQRNGHTLKAIAHHSGIPYNTLRSYFPADEELIPCIMPISALVQLFGVIRDDWLSILTEPEGYCFTKATDEDEAAAKEVEAAKAALDRALSKLKTASAQ